VRDIRESIREARVQDLARRGCEIQSPGIRGEEAVGDTNEAPDPQVPAHLQVVVAPVDIRAPAQVHQEEDLPALHLEVTAAAVEEAGRQNSDKKSVPFTSHST
jgi:hypothetical protein